MPDSSNEETVRLTTPPPTVVFSRYRLIAELGRGGMGVVWRAEDMKLEREVALKFLPDDVVHDREAMADLTAETRRCLALTHPHIVRVYDLVEGDGRAAISMELVDGPSLAERKRLQPGRCFSVDALRPWIAQLCAALDYAHTKVRIVHRDLKPLNLLVNADGDLKVVDFGIARSLLASGTRLTRDLKSTSVSLAYASPQQVLGEPASIADDIYSLGATLYELLTSKPPFYEGNLLAQLQTVVPPPIPDRRAALGLTVAEKIPVAWEETIAACLAKEAGARPRSAAEVAARLGLTADTVSLNTSSRPTRRRRPSPIFVAAGIAAIALLAAVGIGTWRDKTPAEANPAADATLPAPSAPAKPASQFVVTVSPPDAGARVWLGPEKDRTVPDNGELSLSGLPVGEHELIVQASGYMTARARVTTTDSGGSVTIKLTPVFAPLVIMARPGTSVTATDARGRERSLGALPATGPLRLPNTLTIGTYTFRFVHPDCMDVELANVALTIGKPNPNRLAPAQTARPGELRVFSVPDGAAVLLNDKEVGTTPATIPVPSEKPQKLEIVLRGYRRDRRTVTLKPGQTQTIDAGALVLESGALVLKLGAEEFRLPGAVVRVDGSAVAVQNGGRITGLEIGRHELEITHADYQPWKQTVEVRDRLETPVTVKLAPQPAALTFAITGPENFTATANGKPLALKNNLASVPAGEDLTLEIAARGYRTVRRQLTLAPRQKHTLALTLEKIAVPEPGQPWTVPELGLQLLPLAAGTFTMGSEQGDPTERPQTTVTLTKPFWLGRAEVTQREWSALMGANPSRFKGDTLPVENVSWIDATEFCRKLTERERAADRVPAGYVYALPTEAQWEYAARAGATNDAPPDLAESAWHGRNSDEATHPVAARPANAWGFCDMLGNVWEWCADWYAEKLKGGTLTDPKGNTSGTFRVRRGSSYVIPPNLMRYASRGKAEPDFRTYNLGFRVALVPER